MFDVENPPQQAVDPVEADTGDDTDSEAQLQAQVERLQLFQEMLRKRREEAVTARVASGTERRWLEDTANYNGRDPANRRVDLMEAVAGEMMARRQSPQDTQQANRSTVFVQLTRQKTNTAAARIADMLYPTDDKNWGIKPTPVPELMDAAKNGAAQDYVDPSTQQPLQHPQSGTGEGNPPRNITMADLALEQMAIAQQKSEAMEKEINDQLTECQYNYEGRKVIQDAAMLGTGILKGPAVTNRVSKKWRPIEDGNGSTVQVLEVLQETKPESYRVDPWNFYPDPACGENVQDGTYCFEREPIAGRNLAKLAKVPGYNRAAIAMCLREGPKHVHTEGSYTDVQRAGEFAYDRGLAAFEDKRFELWTYVGEATREDLEAAGVEIPDTLESYLVTISAVIVMCNDRIIKALLNPMDTGDFPYDVFNWERIPLSPFGLGIPYLMRYAQRTLNAAWRAMLDNMSLSSGPQIVINRKGVEPADGKWTLTARKIWYAKDTEDVQKAMWLFDVPSHQVEIENVIKLAMQFADAETSLPQIAQGEQGAAPDQVGSMTILMNSANTVLRRLVKQYDDQITSPHIRRYYDWNMQYNPKEEIKGDFETNARGSSVLVVRDEQQKALGNLFQMSKDPDYGVFINKKKLFIQGLKMNHLTPDDVMNTPEQIEQLQQQQQQNPPQDPRIAAAQISAASAEKIAAAKASAEQEYANTEAQMARDANATELSKMEMQREILILEYSMKQNMQLTQVKAQLAELALTLNSKHAISNADRMATAAQRTGPPAAATPQLSPDTELTQ